MLDADQKVSLTEAIEQNDIEMLEKALGEGADPDQRNEDGDSLLYLAVLSERPHIVEMLLNAGADPNLEAVAGEGETALHTASLNGDETSVAALLMAGAAADCPVRCGDEELDGRTPLMCACSSPVSTAPEVISLLLAAGADVKAKDALRRNALMHMIEAGPLRRTNRLLAATGSRNEEMVLQIRAIGHLLESLEKLGEDGRGSQSEDACLRSAQLLVESGIDLSDRDGSGKTAMDYAEAHGDQAMVFFLQGCPEVRMDAAS